MTSGRGSSKRQEHRSDTAEVRSVRAHPPAPLLSPAYVAGIIDGEGSIYARYGGNPHVSVANTYKPLIDGLARFGGYVNCRNRNRSIGNLQSWEWIICGEKAAIMLRACLPHLLIKRDKAIAVLATWNEVGGRGTCHDYYLARARAAMIPLLDGEWADGVAESVI